MAADQKNLYVLQSQEDAKRYEKEMNELKTQGFFTDQDGIKSTDKVAKKKRSHAISATDQETSPVTIKRKAITEPA